MAEDKKKLRPGQKKLMDTLKKSQKKGADTRARSKATKPSGGTFTERVKKTPKAGGPPEKKNLPAIRKDTSTAVRRDNLPVARKDSVPSVNRGGKTDIVRYKGGNLPAKAGDVSPKSNFGSGLGGTIARGLYRTVGGPATMLVSMTTPAGEGSDKPSGPLMKGGKQPGYKYRDETKKNPVPANPNRGLGEAKKSAPVPKARPDTASDFKKKNLEANQKVGKKAAPERKTFAKKDSAPKFRGNWKGAAPTAMQARGGARIKRKSLFG